MPYIGKPQSADPITVNTSNIDDGTIQAVDISSSFREHISGSFAQPSGNVSGSSTSTGSFGKVEVGNGKITTTGNMTLDADGAQIRFEDGGTEFGRISRVSSDLVIKSMSNNNDILFKGVDGSATITALQLDMSEAGNAIFNNDVTIAGTLTAQEIHTEFTSASILFTSGSTKFGDSSDDVHNVTGSMNISGSLTLNDGTLTVTDNVDFNGAVDMASTLTIGGDLTIPQKIVHSGDTDNYLSFGTDSLSIYQGGAEKINFQYGNIYIKTNNQSLVGYTTGGGAKELIKLNDSDLVQIGEASGGDVAITEKLTVGSWDNSNTHGHANLNISSDANEGADSYLNFAAGTTIKGYISYDHHATAGSQAMKFFVGDAANQALTIAGDGRVAIKATSFPQDFGGERGHLLISSTDNAGANNYGVLLLQGHSIANDVATGGIYFYDHDNNTATIQVQRDDSTSKGNMLFYTNGGSGVTERMQIQSDGVVTTQGDFKPGADVIMASGRGISFTATSDATGMSSELLDDYEEGVYDITIGGLGGGSIGLDSSKQALSYTKIGRQVTVQGEISVTSVSSLSGTMTINLPFSVGSTIGDLSSRAIGSFSSQNHNFNDFGLTIHSHTYEGQSVMYFVYHKDNAGWEYVNTNTLASNSEFRVSLTYFTN